MPSYDIVIVGAGISGATLAERYANLGKKVLVLEKRDHIGGNCADYYNADGILVSRYGAHIFHTDHEDVWQYLQQFSRWRPYEHRVVAKVGNKLVPVPVNRTTVNTLFGANLTTTAQMRAWLKQHQLKTPRPKNGEQAALARVGRVIYQKMFQNYTRKQWGKNPRELDASVLNRIPVRLTDDDRYFHDRYQALPAEGYTKLFEKMLRHPRITVRLKTDFFDVKDALGSFEKLFYTGPIDRFFDFKHSLKKHLEYRSLRFEWKTYRREQYQSHAVVNYPAAADGAFTRIVEYKHLTGQKHPKTTIAKEYPVDHVEGQTEPFYPVPTPENRRLFAAYKKEADRLQNIYFVGRLANYKYFNMDEACKSALDLFAKLEGKKARHAYADRPR